MILISFGGVLALAARGDVSNDSAAKRALAPDFDLRGASGQDVYPETMQIGAVVEEPPGEVRWTYVSYLTSDGPCLDLVAEQIKGDERGRISRCGEPDTADDRFRWSIGGVELGGTLYNVVEGEALARASRVKVTLGDGTSTSAPVVDGVWVTVVAGATPFEFDPRAIQQLDSGGAPLGGVEPPSVADSFEAAFGEEGAASPRLTGH